MTITVKTVSDTYGGSGGSNSDDFHIIIYQIIDGESINNINVKSIKVQTDPTSGYLNSLQFIYNVETNYGKRIVNGSLRGLRTGKLQTYDLNSNEKMKTITGSYGNNSIDINIVIKYLKFQTSAETISYGKNDTADTLFTFPAGILFGNSAYAVDSLGTYVIVEVPTNSSTTSNPLSTTSNSSSDITSTSFIILSCFTNILGLIVLVTVVIFLWRKFHRGYIPTR
ncbi:14698_t:CDS:1 [Gigaspora rosea]|nr:14698_t:CDS:1 [Gigaspora rosea]